MEGLGVTILYDFGMVRKLIFFLAILLFALCGCENDLDRVGVISDGDASVRISLNASAHTPIKSGGLSSADEQRMDNLHVIIFNSSGKAVTNRYYGTVIGNSLTIDTRSGNGHTIFVLCNMGSTATEREDMEFSNSLLRVANRAELASMVATLSDSGDLFERQAGLISIGESAPVNVQPGTGNTLDIELSFLSSRIDLVVKDETPAGSSFVAYGWDIVNLPRKSFILQGAADATDPNISTDFITTASKFAFNEDVSGDRTTSFYMFENRRGGRVPNSLSPPSGGSINDGNNLNKAWYAPAKATFIIIHGAFSDGSNSEMVQAIIYLGRDNHSNYDVSRGDNQQFTVTVKGINDINIDTNIDNFDSEFSVVINRSDIVFDTHPDYVYIDITGAGDGVNISYATIEVLDYYKNAYNDRGFSATWLKVSPLDLYSHSIKQGSGLWQQFAEGADVGTFVRPKYIPHKRFRNANPSRATDMWSLLGSEEYPADDDELPFDKATHRMCYRITNIPFENSAFTTTRRIYLYADQGSQGFVRDAFLRVRYTRANGFEEVKTFEIFQTSGITSFPHQLEVESVEEAELPMQWGYNNTMIYPDNDRFSRGAFLTANSIYSGVSDSGTDVPVWSEDATSIYRPKWPRTGDYPVTEPSSTATSGFPYFYPTSNGTTDYFHPVDNSSAARHCHEKNRDLNGDGKIEVWETQWYLPSFADLWALKSTYALSFLNNYYWTSSEEGATHAFVVNPAADDNVATSIALKSDSYRVRCVRGVGVIANLNDGDITSNDMLNEKLLDLRSCDVASPFNVTDDSGIPWTVTSDASWLRISPWWVVDDAAESQTGACSTPDYHAIAPSNNSYTRNANIILSRPGMLTPKYLTVRQIGYDAAYPDHVSIDDNGKLNVDGNGRVLFFKFGSVVGFDQFGQWSTSSILFDPVSTAINYNNYINVPVFSESDFNSGVVDISTRAYHNGANVKLGKGDPCQLIGLTAEQIKNMSNKEIEDYDSGYKMFTSKDYITMTGQTANVQYGKHWTSAKYTSSGLAGAYFPKGSESKQLIFVPAFGYRNSSGITTMGSESAAFWSCSVFNNQLAYSFDFDSINVRPNVEMSFNSGYAVRCVRKIYVSPPGGSGYEPW